MKELMIDLETLGTKTNCVVISIGAVFFDIETKQLGKTFYANFDIKEQIDLGVRKLDADTIKWWMSQEDAAKRVFKEKSDPTKAVLELFRKWVMENTGAGKTSKASKNCNPWGYGANFDISIIESLMQDYGVDVPWLYYNTRCLRTFKEFKANGESVPRIEGTHHNALDDAKNQALYVLKYV